MDDEVAQLVNLSTGEPIASISQAQLHLLKTRLEQEFGADTNVRITPETLEFLKFLREKGADELAGLLATALGDGQELLVGYAPIRGTGSGHVRGRLLHLETQAPLIGYKIEAYDDDLVFDDLLG